MKNSTLYDNWEGLMERSPPPYGIRVPFSGDYVPLVYAYGRAPIDSAYLITYDSTGHFVDELQVYYTKTKKMTSTVSVFEKPSHVHVIEKEFERGRGLVDADTTTFTVRPDGTIVEAEL